ncbi:AAA family ATPase [Deinococcus maricopensis]|uniref:ATPase associated with various cellular activities AAA_5 n=1 Tax=Deinococcus maricopensis (strain DSM 21211 / LMG 22137 / NRRL B-23946 / LB-34) TaxID=709986 RepID=E8U8Z9_DEIML|nr:MoxR family ATPase [Deinococcus maricopensis]ADV67538.1 ATPase associated with various cellular activities AAA_5 [Deinococcus maricopensis DSM 21211]
MSLSPAELERFLSAVVRDELTLSLMIWGAPGVGKSSVVQQVASAHDLGFVDVRLSQLAPTDLRGLPVAEDGVSRWYPPEFLPRSGRGVLFLDEINMAPPTMQGMAQQLILDRRVGSYVLPDGWFVWAAGNRKEDRASVFDMPAPLGNRFLHLEVRAEFEAWRAYALARGLHEHVLAFLTFRPELLHRLDTVSPAWPSPRSWEMASRLHRSGLPVGPAVGEAAGAEFEAFVRLYDRLPDLLDVLEGRAAGVSLPAEPSVRYAAVVGLAARARGAEQAHRAFRWLADGAGAEWLQLFVATLIPRLSASGELGELAALMERDADLAALVQDALSLAEA